VPKIWIHILVNTTTASTCVGEYIFSAIEIFLQPFLLNVLPATPLMNLLNYFQIELDSTAKKIFVLVVVAICML
jgi:hypothetical protein